jgi:hypothetical protein
MIWDEDLARYHEYYSTRQMNNVKSLNLYNENLNMTINIIYGNENEKKELINSLKEIIKIEEEAK